MNISDLTPIKGGSVIIRFNRMIHAYFTNFLLVIPTE
jgi:hypothetical protein